MRQLYVSSQNKVKESFVGKQIDVAGDGKCDSPGHCALYGMYSIMECDNTKILSCEMVKVNRVAQFFLNFLAIGGSKYDIICFFLVLVYRNYEQQCYGGGGTEAVPKVAER